MEVGAILCASFPRWGAAHIGALLFLAGATALLLVLGKRQRELCVRTVAGALLLCWGGEALWRAQSTEFPLYPGGLPLHFCSIMMLVAAAALLLRWHGAAALTCFAVPAVCAQALITPTLDATFPSPRYFFFFASHGLLLIAAAVLLLVMNWRARRPDPLFCVLMGDVYLLLIHPVNLLLGENYGFTVEAASGSILCLLGAAPWYYLWLQLPALALFELMYVLYRPQCKLLDRNGTGV